MRRLGSGPVFAGVGTGTALLYFVGMAAALPALCVAVKPFPALALAAWVALRCPRLLGRLTTAGLVLSAVGDMLLETGLFLPGLLAFLSAHLAYVAAFLSAERRPVLGRAVPFVAWGLLAFSVLLSGLGAMALPVAVYVAVICTMMWRAAARVGSPGTPALAASLGLAGAVRVRRERHADRLQPLRCTDPRRPLADHGPLLARTGRHRVLHRPRLRYRARTGDDTITTTASSPARALSVETIRSRFPALERLHHGRPVAYFDGPGGTQVPRDVADAMADYLLHHNANTHWASVSME